MASTYVLKTESLIAGYNEADIDGRWLAKLDGQLDRSGFFARRNQKALMEFWGDDMSPFLNPEGVPDLNPDMLCEWWFDPTAALATVLDLIDHLNWVPGFVEHQDIILKDLAVFEAILRKCKAQGVQWRLSIRD